MQPTDKILLGLYRFRPVLDENLPLGTEELAWLLDNGCNTEKYKFIDINKV